MSQRLLTKDALTKNHGHHPPQLGGWVKRKVKNSEKWVRRWLEVNKYILYSYQANPAETPEARVMNTLDLRKTKEIKALEGGHFVIVPDVPEHPGYLMRVAVPKSSLNFDTPRLNFFVRIVASCVRS